MVYQLIDGAIQEYCLLLTIEIIIGQQLLRVDSLLDLGIGVTKACLKSDGTSPSLTDVLNSLVNEPVMLKAVSFNILADIPLELEFVNWPL